MRNYFEHLYVNVLDYAHVYFKTWVLPKSFMYDDDFALSGNPYWKVVAYVAIVNMYEHDFPYTEHSRLGGIIDSCSPRRTRNCITDDIYTDNDVKSLSMDNIIY